MINLDKIDDDSVKEKKHLCYWGIIPITLSMIRLSKQSYRKTNRK